MFLLFYGICQPLYKPLVCTFSASDTIFLIYTGLDHTASSLRNHLKSIHQTCPHTLQLKWQTHRKSADSTEECLEVGFLSGRWFNMVTIRRLVLYFTSFTIHKSKCRVSMLRPRKTTRQRQHLILSTKQTSLLERTFIIRGAYILSLHTLFCIYENTLDVHLYPC